MLKACGVKIKRKQELFYFDHLNETNFLLQFIFQCFHILLNIFAKIVYWSSKDLRFLWWTSILFFVKLTDNINIVFKCFKVWKSDENNINIASKSAVNLGHQYKLTKCIVCVSQCKVMHHPAFFKLHIHINVDQLNFKQLIAYRDIQ